MKMRYIDIPKLSYIFSSKCTKKVPHDRVLFMGQIELYCFYAKLNCLKQNSFDI